MSHVNPAFPFTYTGDGGQNLVHPGMEFRDLAAALALPAVIRQCAGDQIVNGGTESPEAYFSKKAVACADALIAELSK